MSTWKTVRAALDQLPGLVGDLKRGTLSKRLALFAASAIVIGCGLAGPWLPREVAGPLRAVHAAWIFFGCGALLTVWLVAVLIRTASPGPRTSAKIRPTAIKGAGSFGSHDGDLFARLGRGQEIATLLSHVLDDQVGLVAVMGESGAGKTSLLRSGLFHQLKLQQPALARVYWEALPSAPLAGLVHAVGAEAKPPRKAPATLEDVERWAERTGSVVVLDQLEQLDPADPGHAPIFDLLSRLGHRRPPYRSTWIVAFRDDFDPIWRYFELDHPHLQTVMVGLRLFHPRTAKEVMATLGATVDLILEEALLDDLFQAAGQRGLISPVDVGIGMLVLYELAERLQRRSLRLENYRFAGGAEGLLTAYLFDHLRRFAEPERAALLRALLRLVDLPANRRIAEGVGLEELASASGLAAARVQQFAEMLVEARLLEEVEARRYRLLHERIIEPLRRLTGSVLAAGDLARIGLEEGYRRWKGSREPRDLLRGRALRAALRYRDQLGPLGPDEQRYLKRSHNRRRWREVGWGVAGLVGVAGLLVLQNLEVAVMARQSLQDWGLPGDLYDYQRQIKTLSISQPIRNLRWLRAPIEDLTVNGEVLSEIGSLPATVHRLHVTGGRVPRFTIPLPQLEALVLDGERGEGKLPPAGWLPRLRTLTVRGVGDSPIFAYRQLRELTILDGQPPEVLSDVARLPSLENLEISILLTCSPVGNEPLVSGVANLGGLRIRWLGRCVFELPSLPRPSVLRGLTLIDDQGTTVSIETAGASKVQALALRGAFRLSSLPNVRSLDLRDANLLDWEALEGLPSVNEVMVTSDDFARLAKLPQVRNRLRVLTVRDSMNRIALQSFSRLRSVRLEIWRPLSYLPEGLQSLPELEDLEVSCDSARRFVDFKALGRLSRLKHLSVRNCSHTSSLSEELRRLVSLESLEAADSPAVDRLTFAIHSGVTIWDQRSTPFFGRLVDLGASAYHSDSWPRAWAFPPKLTRLALTDASWPDLSRISPLGALKELSLERSQVTSLRGMPPSVERLAF